MMKRKISEENRTLHLINVKNLDFSKIKEENEKLLSISNGNDKLLYINSYLENNIEPKDIFSNLYYPDQDREINDIVKYFLIYQASLFDKDIKKKYFPNLNIKENNIILDNSLFMSKRLFQILFSLLLNSQIKEVQYTIYELILSYSSNSNDFINYCLEDQRYIQKIIQFTYANFKEIINNSLLILNNIFSSCEPAQLENILPKYSIVERCKELLENSNLDNDLKINCLEILYTISQNIEGKFFESYFFGFINIFYNLIVLQKKNEDIFMLILKICVIITNDDNICLKIKETGLIDIFYQVLSVTNLQREFLIKLIKIFSNLFYQDEIINYFIIEKNAEIIKVFIIIINTYMHTCNESSNNKLIVDLFYCISNIAAGPKEAQYIFSKSELPNLVIQMMKTRNNNDIYYEGIQILNNLISDCNKETFYNVSELNPFKIYAKALNNTLKVDNLSLYLSAIVNLIENNNKFYHTLENLKKEFYICLIKQKIENLLYHENNTIAEMAKKIVDNLEDKMKMDD